MSEEKPASFYTGQGYLKVGIKRYAPLYNEIITLLDEPEKSSTIVDLGCGVGYFASILYKEGYRNYIGMDFSSHMIKYSKERVPQYEYILIDFNDEELIEVIRNYELFIMLETLEHIINDLHVLKKIPSGSLIIGSVPNMDSKTHVRTFRGISDVFNRYKSIIDFNFLKEVKINPNKKDNIFTIFRGTIRDD
jgi:2-polyprenyl-3-methyl-5-hydroxy-6-metoxy-1,4-benzoquinol methylase